MKHFLREYFSFSRSEMRVVICISFLTVLLFIIRILLYSADTQDVTIPEEMETEVSNFIASFEEMESNRSEDRVVKKERVELLKPEIFDPNHISKDQLLQMGISGRATSNLLAYREAGGIFRKKEDLQKIYGLQPEVFEIIKPYIKINVEKESFSAHEKPVFKYKKKSIIIKKTEINSAGKTELMKIRGIGEVLSSRIIKYRNILGGFVRTDQLSEVYGINDSMVCSWNDILYADSSLIRNLSVNNSEYKMLLRHPYLQKKDVDAIFKLREWSDEDLEPYDLQEFGILSDSVFKRLRAYLVR